MFRAAHALHSLLRPPQGLSITSRMFITIHRASRPTTPTLASIGLGDVLRATSCVLVPPDSAFTMPDPLPASRREGGGPIA